MSEESSDRRSVVAKLLRAKKWQEASDRALAIAAQCHRTIVQQVRRRLIHEGRHPPRAGDVPRLDEEGKPLPGYVPAYKEGAACRGGYVYGPDGKPMRETTYLKLKANRKKATRARKG